MRSDVKSYYASINHEKLFEKIKKYVTEAHLLSIIYQYLKHVEYRDGIYIEAKKGICRRCSLSPLLGALYLSELDEAMSRMDVFYIRYMDDWIIMAENRWSFRRAVKRVNSILEGLGVQKAEDKTYLGKIEKGFDFFTYNI